MRKRELHQLLERTAAARSSALFVLVKANRLTRHLTNRQRQMIDLAYTLVELKSRIHARNPLAFVEPDGLTRDFSPPDDCRNLRELKQRGLLVLAMIDRVKERLLQLDILEARLRELILSLEKATEAFCHEARIIRREIYPFGVFSRLRRGVRVLWGRAYFTLRDMERISDLGIMTSHVLKIADSPVM